MPNYPKFKKFSIESLSPLKLKMAVLKKESMKYHKVQMRKGTYSELKMPTSTWMKFFRITNFKVFFPSSLFSSYFFPYYLYFQVSCNLLIITAALSIPALEINEAFISLDPLRILCYRILRSITFSCVHMLVGFFNIVIKNIAKKTSFRANFVSSILPSTYNNNNNKKLVSKSNKMIKQNNSNFYFHQ